MCYGQDQFSVMAKNMWAIVDQVHVPHLATDDYVKSLALFLKEHVDSKLVIHVEYSNECWNTEFACNAYASVRPTTLIRSRLAAMDTAHSDVNNKGPL